MVFSSLSIGLIWAVPAPAEDWGKKNLLCHRTQLRDGRRRGKDRISVPCLQSVHPAAAYSHRRRSCGCTTPIVETDYIQPGQTGSILARFNTDTFRGTKGATLTVVFDQPIYSEVRLRVDGYIRSDMVFHPGAIEFGNIKQGESMAKVSKVYYAGRSDWEIVDIRSNVPWLVPSTKLVSRDSRNAQYELSVVVREDAPTGVFQNEIVVVTNDTKRPQVPFQVMGNVESPLSISPQAIAFGSLKPDRKLRNDW